MIPIKSAQEITMMKEAGSLLACVTQALRKIIKKDITTAAIDREAEKEFRKHHVVSAFKGYQGFPAAICVSVNEEIVHGIPGERLLKDGDIVSVDLGIKLNGFFSDMAFTVVIGKANAKVAQLIQITREALQRGIKQARVNNRIGDISFAVQKHVEAHGFSVVRDFVGHGIGRELHEEPQIPNFGEPHTGETIKEGMVFAIEPMVNMGTWQARILENRWTAVTQDRMPSCHFEHTVAVQSDGPLILTQ